MNNGGLATSVSVTVRARPPIPTGYAGTRRDPDGIRYRFAMALGPQGGEYSGYIVWTLVDAGTRGDLRSQVGRKTTEFVRGTYDPAVDTLRLAGYSVHDLAVVRPGRYHLGFSLTRDTASGRGGDTDDPVRGRLLARRADPPVLPPPPSPNAPPTCVVAGEPLVLQAGTRGRLPVRAFGDVPVVNFVSADTAIARVTSPEGPLRSGSVVNVVVEAGRAGSVVLTGECGNSRVTTLVRVEPRTSPMIEVNTTASVELRRFAALVNEHRSRVLCLPLQWDDRAARVAQEHAEAAESIAELGAVDNRVREERFLEERLRALGVSPRRAAHDDISGAFSAHDVLLAWFDRASSRANLETCAFTHHGVGKAGQVWTHVLYADSAARDTLRRVVPNP